MGLEYLSTDETCRVLGLTEDELAEWIASGRLRAYVDDNRTRFLRGDVEGARMRRSLKLRTARRVRNPNAKPVPRLKDSMDGDSLQPAEIFDPDSLPGESLFGEADLSEEEAEAAIDRILRQTERPAAQASEPRSYRLRKELKERSKREILEEKKPERPQKKKKARKLPPRSVTVHDEDAPEDGDDVPIPFQQDLLDSEVEDRKARKKAEKKARKEEKAPKPAEKPEKKKPREKTPEPSESGEAPAPPPKKKEKEKEKEKKKAKGPQFGAGLPLRLDEAALPGPGEMDRLKKTLVGIGLVAVFGAIFAYNLLSSSGLLDADDLEEVVAEEVGRGDIVQSVASQGQVVPNDRAEVKPAIRGEVAAISVEVGHSVRRGQPLFVLAASQLEHEEEVARTQVDRARKSLGELEIKIENANRELEYQKGQIPKRREEAQRKVDEAEREANSIQIEIDGVRLRIKQAEEQHARVKSLFEVDKIGRQVDVDDAKQKVDAVKIELRQVEARLESARARVDAAKAQLDEAGNLFRYEGDVRVLEASIAQVKSQISEAEANHRLAVERLRDKNVASPIDGVVQSIPVRLGDKVDPSTVLAEVVDLSRIFLEAEIDENEIFRIERGQTARISIEAFPGRVYEGKVERIASEGRRRAGGSDISVFPTRIVIEKPVADLKGLRPGMTGRADVTTLVEKNVLVVPQAAVVRRRPEGAGADAEQESYVFLLRPAKEPQGAYEVVQEKVLTGVLDEIHIQVTSGLKGGETIVVGPFHALEKLKAKSLVKLDGKGP